MTSSSATSSSSASRSAYRLTIPNPLGPGRVNAAKRRHRARIADTIAAIASGLEDEPEAWGRRETMEEAGVRLGGPDHIGRIWTMPSNAEEIDSVLAPCSAADRVSLGESPAHEQETIRVHEIALDALWTMFEEKRLLDGKLAAMLLALL